MIHPPPDDSVAQMQTNHHDAPLNSIGFVLIGRLSYIYRHNAFKAGVRAEFIITSSVTFLHAMYINAIWRVMITLHRAQIIKLLFVSYHIYASDDLH